MEREPEREIGGFDSPKLKFRVSVTLYKKAQGRERGTRRQEFCPTMRRRSRKRCKSTVGAEGGREVKESTPTYIDEKFLRK